MGREFLGVNVAVLAVSEAISIADEPAALLVVDRLTAAGHRVLAQAVVADSVQAIRAELLRWIADAEIDAVIVTAGIATEHAGAALAPLLTRRLPGFADLLRMLTFDELGSAAMLAEAEAGQCKSTFVFLLPAAIGAVQTALDKLLLPQLDHRTRPRNVVHSMPRLASQLALDPSSDAAPHAPRQPEPWILPKAAQAREVRSFAASPRTTSSAAWTASSGEGSVSQLAIKVSTAVSVSELLPRPPSPPDVLVNPPAGSQLVPVVEPVSTRASTDVGPPPPPRTKISATISAPLPIKPPAKIIPLAALLTSPAPATLADAIDHALEAEDEALDAAIAAAPVLELEPEASREEPEPAPSPGPEPILALSLALAPSPRVPPAPDPVVVSAPAIPLPSVIVHPSLDDEPRRIAFPPVRRRRRTGLYALLAVGTVLAATSAVLVVVLVQRGAKPESGELVASRDPAIPSGGAPAELAEREPSEPAPSEREVAVPAGPSTPAVPAPQEIDMTGTPAPARVVRNAPATPRSRPPSARPASVPVEAAAPITPPAELVPAPVEANCDEVSCILDHYKLACCKAYKPIEAPPAIRPASALPDQLDRQMVQQGLAPMKPAVIACGERFGVRGTVKLAVKVSPDGKVTSVSVTATPDEALGACAATAVGKASFGATENGGSFNYPFVF